MSEIGVAIAAQVLGINESAVRKMQWSGRLTNLARPGEAARFAAGDVSRVLRERRADAQTRHPDAAAFAREVRSMLWPMEKLAQVHLTDGRSEIADAHLAHHLMLKPSGRRALAHLTPDAVALFGRAAVEVAAADPQAFTGACRWCYADASARVHGGFRPTDSPAYRVLLGTDPCDRDRTRWQAEAEAHRTEAARLRTAEAAARDEAAKLRAAADFQAARRNAETAAQRLRSAATAYAAADPSVALQASAQGRGRALTASGCGCTRDRYCAGHTAMFGTSDRRQARR
ncbi:hypothetical protein [Streptomyces sp. NPDC048188]|uniref:hypothetical protein n=1 Tax=Streptomyces sp. NPDC048188 TaxID=3155749 RepID=UPI003419B847